MKRTRLPLIAFAMTQCGKTLLWSATDAFSLYILITVVRVPPATAGALFLLSCFWNAVMDGLWGCVIARSPAIRHILPELGMGAAMIGCAAFVLLPWLPSGSVGATVGAVMLFRTVFPLFDVPHNACIAVLAQEHGHLVVARWRTMLSAGTGLLVTVAALPLIAAGPSGDLARIVFLVIALAALVLLAPLAWLLRVMERPDQREEASRGAMALVPRGALLFFGLTQMVGIAALGVMGKAILHVDTLPPLAIDSALLLLGMVRLGAIWLWSPVARKIGSLPALGMAYVFAALAVLLLPIAIGQGVVSFLLILAILGLATGGVGFLIWASFSELLARVPGGGWHGAASVSYGWMTAMSKVGLGFSGLLTGAWLSRASSMMADPPLWPLAESIAGLCMATALVMWMPGSIIRWLRPARVRKGLSRPSL